MAFLQLALDFVDSERALAVAREASEFVDWLEAGTPLVKSEGIRVVRELRKLFPSKTIVADLKIMDVGALEVEMAAKAGAGVVTVLGAADDATIREAVEAGKKFGALVEADILNVVNPAERAKQLEKLGVQIVGVHVGIDQQMRGMLPLSILREVRKAVKCKVAVAGGITAENVSEYVEAGADVIVVGGGITKNADVRSAAQEIKTSMQLNTAKKQTASSGSKEKQPSLLSVDDEIRSLLFSVSSCNASDAMHREGGMRGILSITPGLKAVGKAFTARAFPGDWAKPVEAIDEASEGDVIVVDCGGVEKAVWGALASESAKRKKLSGVVINGGIRDVEEIRKMGFPAFAKFVTPCTGEPKGFGETNVAIECGGRAVKPGDWILADDSGVVIIPGENALEIAKRAKDVKEKEERVLKEIKNGSSLGEVLRLKKWEKIMK
ncbi:orotidine 5'-phosphate decarboxylase [Candidatus Micrarchaeota archaeon]|nr:orotidine 5'-phosphate decarboxylase [Candidatus Micrarchaeota archaeon]